MRWRQVTASTLRTRCTLGTLSLGTPCILGTPCTLFNSSACCANLRGASVGFGPGEQKLAWAACHPRIACGPAFACAGNRVSDRPIPVGFDSADLELRALIGKLDPRYRRRAVLQQLDVDMSCRADIIHSNGSAECSPAIA